MTTTAEKLDRIADKLEDAEERLVAADNGTHPMGNINIAIGQVADCVGILRDVVERLDVMLRGHIGRTEERLEKLED